MAIDFNKMMENAKKTADGFASSMATAMRNLAENGQKAIANFKESQDKKNKAVSEALKVGKEREKSFRPEDAIHIILNLIAVDGKITQIEIDRFHEIGLALDKNFSSYESKLIEEEQALLSQIAGDEEELYATLLDNVGKIIHADQNSQAGIGARKLLWDLLTVAYSNENYADYEKKMIRYIAKGSGVDYPIVLEMEQTLRTLLVIQEEENWLKSTDRLYSIVAERLEALEVRKGAIMNGVYALMED